MFKTLGEKLRNKPKDSLQVYFIRQRNCLNFTRALLASLVCFSHVGWIYGEDNLQIRSLGVYSVAIFFGLSGFLIYQSAQYSSGFREFALRRVRRIYPAFLGVLVATSVVYYPLYVFFSEGSFKPVQISQQFFYTANNLTLHIFKPELNDSLETSGTQVWNPSLWTLKYEFTLYLICFFLSRLFIKNSQIYIYLMTASFAVLANVLPRENLLQEFVYLAQFFFIGMSIWHLKERISTGVTTIGIAVLAIVFSYEILEVFTVTSTFLILLALVLSAKFKFHILQTTDYSYGIYLHAGPVTHLAVLATLKAEMGLVAAYALSMIFSVLLGAFSWHVVESRFRNGRNRSGANQASV